MTHKKSLALVLALALCLTLLPLGAAASEEPATPGSAPAEEILPPAEESPAPPEPEGDEGTQEPETEPLAPEAAETAAPAPAEEPVPAAEEETPPALDGLMGDISGDGVVDRKDRIYLARYLAGWEGYQLSALGRVAADVNSDNVIDRKDRIHLARYLAGWEGYALGAAAPLVTPAPSPVPTATPSPTPVPSPTPMVFTVDNVPGDYAVGSSYGPSLSAARLAEVKQAVADFLNAYYDPSASDYANVKAAHDYLVSTVEYDGDWGSHPVETAWGALIYKGANCWGYSRAFKALCDGMGIGCYYVPSTKTTHAWNIVQVDGAWYHIDVQGNDLSRRNFWFLVSDGIMKIDGYSWDASLVPACPNSYGK